ncbi:MAG TPA: hypothetical protein VGA08_02120 [Candidatus Saccharimonadales bacterium]
MPIIWSVLLLFCLLLEVNLLVAAFLDPSEQAHRMGRWVGRWEFVSGRYPDVMLFFVVSLIGLITTTNGG